MYSSFPNILIISSSLDNPNARRSVVRGTFLVLSILTYKTSLASVSNSSQVPLVGIIWEVIQFLPFLSISLLKYTLGDLTSCDTITRSAPLITKEPLSVIIGMSPKKISCSFTSPVSWLNNLTSTFKGAA